MIKLDSLKGKGIKYIRWIVIFFTCIISCLLFWVYFSFYKEVKQVKDSVLRHTFENGPLSLPIANNDYVATWGAFGDFIGGTLNPFLTFISICLILWTIRQNRKMLDNSSNALKSSIAMQDEVKKMQ